ncbi:MAG: transcriptional antiterminator, Rof [Acidithiobacillus sp.]|nr:transcriptional antiterminator, Rof [Acidithiobacillus sp.]
MKENPTYQPVSCALHSALELAVIRGLRSRLQLHNGETWYGWPLDVWTSGAREWLLWKMEKARPGEFFCLDLIEIEGVNEAPITLR